MSTQLTTVVKEEQDTLRKDFGIETRCLSCRRTPSSHISSPTTKQYLLKLPLEIRTDILERVLLSDGGDQPIKADVIIGRANLRRRSGPNPHRNYSFQGHPYMPHPTVVAQECFAALSSTCSQLYQESSSIFFRKNRFIFHDLLALRVYLDGITPQNRSDIKEVLFVFDHSDNHEWAFGLLGECNLRKLTVGIREGCIHHYGMKVKHFLAEEGAVSLRRIRGLKEMDVKVVQTCCWSPKDLDWRPTQLCANGEEDQWIDAPLAEFLHDTEVALKKAFSKGKAKKAMPTEANPSRETRGMKKKVEERKKVKGVKWTKNWLDEDLDDVLGGSIGIICDACKQKTEKKDESKKKQPDGGAGAN